MIPTQQGPGQPVPPSSSQRERGPTIQQSAPERPALAEQLQRVDWHRRGPQLNDPTTRPTLLQKLARVRWRR